MKRRFLFLLVFPYCGHLSAQNIGIGTTVPSEKLHVIGNIRANGRIDATGVIQGDGVSSTGTFFVNQTSLLMGAVTGNSTASFTGTITSGTGLTINDAAGILQLQDGAVNKGFIQLSGDDLRFGTNSGNTNGEVVLRMDGTDMIRFQKTGAAGTFIQMNLNGVSTGVLQTTSSGHVSLTAVNANAQVQLGGEIFINNTANRTGIGTSNPSERLQVNGNIVINGNAVIDDGRITATPTGSAYNLLPLAYGRVTNDGNKAGGTVNFTSANNIGPGEYNIFVTGATSSSVLVVTAGSPCAVEARYEAPGWFQLRFWNVILDEFFNASFHFVMYNPQ
jgi:hypothetical protein